MKLPDFTFEKELHEQGYKIVAGLDEVGRGAFAGPVVAAAVAFAPNYKLQMTNKQSLLAYYDKFRIDDSKKLSSKQREIADIWIRENCLAYGIGEAGVAQINKFGIKKATEIAFRKAIKSLQLKYKFKIDHLLVDAFYIPYVPKLSKKNQTPIIKGDSLSVSIAAASIIAKVYRDKLMVDLSKKSEFQKYFLDKNKGYGTQKHIQVIQEFGITALHRKKFVENAIRKI